MNEEDKRDVAYNQIATIFGYQNHPQYGEWLLDGNDGPRPCRFENWEKEDLVSFVGGNFAVFHADHEKNGFTK